MIDIECEGQLIRNGAVIGHVECDLPPDNLMSLIRMNQCQFFSVATLEAETIKFQRDAEAMQAARQSKEPKLTEGELSPDELNDLDRLEDEREAEEERRKAEEAQSLGNFAGLDPRIAKALIAANHTGPQSLIDFLKPGDATLTDIPGIGKKPAQQLLKWLEPHMNKTENAQPAGQSS